MKGQRFSQLAELEWESPAWVKAQDAFFHPLPAQVQQWQLQCWALSALMVGRSCICIPPALTPSAGIIEVFRCFVLQALCIPD